MYLGTVSVLQYYTHFTAMKTILMLLCSSSIVFAYTMLRYLCQHRVHLLAGPVIGLSLPASRRRTGSKRPNVNGFDLIGSSIGIIYILLF